MNNINKPKNTYFQGTHVLLAINYKKAFPAKREKLKTKK